VRMRGVGPEPDGLAYFVKLQVEDFFLTGALDSGAVYRRDDSPDGAFVTLRTFSRDDAYEWVAKLQALGCFAELAAEPAPRHDYVVRVRDSASGKLSTHLVIGVPGWGADHRLASAFVEAVTNTRAVGSMRLDGVKSQAARYVRSPYNQALDPRKHVRHTFRLGVVSDP
jgi:hypothetical protein